MPNLDDAANSAAVHYRRFKSHLEEIPALRFHWPKPGQDRIRKIVHRGAMRPTLKYRSITMQRAFHVESPLEQVAMWHLDACPQVSFIGEQPMRISYEKDRMGSHIPDFIARVGTHWEVIEIKRLSTLRSEDTERAEWLTEALSPVARYRMLSEAEFENEATSNNCRQLLMRGRNPPDADLAERIIAGIQRDRVANLGQFDWDVLQSEAAEHVAWLILRGRLEADLSCVIGSATPVTVVADADLLEARLWPA